MSDHWSSAIPEMYFDAIGKIPPGAFLTLVLVGTLVPNPQNIPCKLARLEWGPALGLLLLLLCASYAIGLLIAPIGELANRRFWNRAWKGIGERNFDLLVMKQSRLGLCPPLSPLPAANEITNEQWDTIYSRLHTFLKKADADAKLILPKLSAEIQFSSNFMVVFAVSFVLVAVRTWSAGIGPLLLLALATGLAISSSWKRTTRFVIRHFAYLASI